MPAPSTCTVSGVLYGPGAAALQGVVIKAYITSAFTDSNGNYIPSGVIASTTSASDGTWSLAVIQTQGLGHSITFQFEYPLGNNQSRSVKYPAVIPATSTANFADLVSLSSGTAALSAAPTTDALPEGATNLYYTDARARAALSASSPLTYDSSTGVLSMPSLNTDNVTEGSNLYFTDARADARISAQRGAASGVASLDSGGKVPLTQLPASLMEYQGTWDASTNSPTLADGTGTSGFFYRVNVAGTQDLGSGSQTFVVGDWVMYNGTVWQLAHAGADLVISVAGKTGAVTLSASDVGALATSNNLSDLASASSARSNLGLGTIATKAATSGSAVQKADGSGGLTAATAGTDYQVPITSGDGTTSGGELTLATVNSDVGSFTNASVTVDAKGRVTAASSGTGSATVVPTVQKFTATGTTVGYVFTVTSANATSGATYTNNSNTYTVVGTISSGTVLFCTGTSAPTSSGTLTKASGTGDATITFSATQALATYTRPTGPTPAYLRVRMAGGGGGGGDSASNGVSGLQSVFGTNMLLAGGGSNGGNGGDHGGAGGTATVIGLTNYLTVAGTTGYGGGETNSGNTAGGPGGSTPFFGGGGSVGPAWQGFAGTANTGSGGGGGYRSNGYPGGGGGSGAYIEAIIPSPASTYYYSIGTGGAGASGGSGGGAGADGIIIVEEIY